MTVDMNQFFQVFFEEAEELLAEMEKLLLAIDVDAPDNEDLNAVFRTAHSIKGGASTFGLVDLTEVTHVLESLLDKLRNGEIVLKREHVDAFLSAKDVLKMQLDGHRHGSPVDQNAVADARMMLQSLLPEALARGSKQSIGAKAATGKAPATTVAGTAQFHIVLPTLTESDLDALESELGLLGVIRRSASDDGKAVFHLQSSGTKEDIVAICSFVMDPAALVISREEIHAGTPEAMLAREAAQGYGFFEPFTPYQPPSEAVAESRSESYELSPAEIDASHGAPSGYHENPAESKPAGKASQSREAEKTGVHESSSIRVGIEKVDQLINLVGELVITQAMIEQRTGTLDPIVHERLLNSVNQLTRNTRDLQEAVMSIRMMPMDYVFSRFPRMVRDLAGKLGKKVDFVTHGAATELDKGLIERIVDPLTHLVRNSVDHGIELPEVRVKNGKTEAGKLSLSAAHQGGNIIIEVSDDGGGLSREKILAKAKERGLSVSDAMPDPEVWQLIFVPGFSTADQVTDVSGRGVGMDVVKRNISAMGGMVDVRSSRGFGTTISISLPLTLAILDGMSIKVGEEIYILPLGYVVESLQPAPADVKEISGQGRVIKVRGEYLALIPLHQVFNVEPKFTHPSEGIVVILESDGRKVAILIDELVGQQQVVVKNLESNYRKVAGISGATILGDGGVSLIIDVATLVRSGRQLSDESLMVE
jgi:two-component system chemotaxis sensor kinase CheA